VSFYDEGAAHDRIAAEEELDAALESGDPARIQAARQAHEEAVAAYDQAVAADAEAKAATGAEPSWQDIEPDGARPASLAFWDQIAAQVLPGGPDATAQMAQFEAEFEPEAEP
jgi:hypothetical protein